MPRWVDRLLPHISIEGAEFFAKRDQPATVEPDREADAVAGVAAS
jgi:hypothetical protein